MWCVKRRWAWVRTAWPKAFCLGRVCVGSRPGRRGGAQGGEGGGEHGALESLVAAWETCSPRIDEPERRVTGASPA